MDFDFARLWQIALDDYPHLLKATIFFIVGYCLLIIFRLFLKRALRKSQLATPLKKFIYSFSSVFLFFVLVVVSLSTAGVSSAGLLAVLSGITLAISLALQGVFTNLFNAIYIFVTKIVEVGQVVEVGGHLGIVTDIGLFYTVITTFRKERIFVQNTEICTQKFKNYTAIDIVASDFEFKAANTNSVQAVKDAIWDAIKTIDFRHEDLNDPFEHSEVYVTQYAEDLIFRARVWHKALDGYNMFRALPEAVAFSFEKHNITPAQKVAILKK